MAVSSLNTHEVDEQPGHSISGQQPLMTLLGGTDSCFTSRTGGKFGKPLSLGLQPYPQVRWYSTPLASTPTTFETEVGQEP